MASRASSLTPELALALARAATADLGAQAPRVLIIRDTRESGEMLEAAVAAGVTAAGGDALLGGVLPTPAAPLLLRRYGFDLAVVLSARTTRTRQRHQVLRGRRLQARDATEPAIERRSSSRHLCRPRSAACADLLATLEDYLRELHARFAEPRPERPATCCSTAPTARPTGRAGDLPPPGRRRRPRGRRRPTGATSTTAAAPPTSRRSPRGRAGGHDLGFAFDGDGDRVLAVDRTGTVVDGDELIALAALHLRAAAAPATASRSR